MTTTNVWLNGRIVPRDQAAVSVSDAGFVHGASVFTTMLARNGRVFRMDRHLRRLLDTAAMLSLRTDAAVDELTEAAGELLAANGLRDARMRITLSPGPVSDDGPPTTLVTAEPLPDHPASWYEKGISVVVSSFKQGRGDPTFGYKTGCYFPRILARQEAAAKGAEEALWYTPDNCLAEACFCNAFLVLGGKVFTPPRDTPVLPGIVREAVIELCGQMDIECLDDQALTVRDMLGAAEMFLTSSINGLRPVVRVERHPVGQEKPGPVTTRLMDAYRALLEKECP